MESVELRFHGAAGTVTGSCFEFRGGGTAVLVDCGLFEGTRSLEAINHEKFYFDPAAIDAVILTQASLGHSGRLPWLAASGCEAPVWMTEPTAAIVEPLLLDAASVQAAEAERRNRRPNRAGRAPFQPLYAADDVARLLAAARITRFCEWNDLGGGNGFRLWDARHIVGSASVELLLGGQRILVSGDVGNGSAMFCAAAELGSFDHIVCAGTYGDRDQVPALVSDRREQLARHVEEVRRHGGNLLIPAAAVETTQVVLDDFAALFETGRLEPVDVFVDSPRAEAITRATLRHRHGGYDLLDHPHIRFVQDVAESKRLGGRTGAVIIAGSPMCQSGRIRRHLLCNLPNPHSRVLLTGYQVQGTLGAALLGGARHVRISGHDVDVQAGIHATEEYSTHADRLALRQWLKARAPVSGSVFLVHGEEAALTALAAEIGRVPGIGKPVIPGLDSAWQLRAAQEALQVRLPRSDARERTSPQDWISGLADFEAALSDKLRALPSDSARKRAMASLRQALQQAELR